MDEIPRHIAIIMDGNGRWAKQRNLPRIAGHRSGAKALENVIEICAREKIKALTLFTFSMENWKRPKKEVDALMALFEKSLNDNIPKLKKNGIRFNCIGRIDELSRSLSDKIRVAMKETSETSGMILTLALNYGSRQEIVDAVKSYCSDNEKTFENGTSLSENDFEKYLYTKDLPELDLIIRTSGEMRLSNFLLWQAAYAEIYVTEVLWPDFNEEEFNMAIEEFNKRDRRFGG